MKLSRRRADAVAKLVACSALEDLAHMTGNVRDEHAEAVQAGLVRLSVSIVRSMSDPVYEQAVADYRAIRTDQ